VAVEDESEPEESDELEDSVFDDCAFLEPAPVEDDPEV
jgi:hypothetical protein